jgi:hypothetical protein
MKRIVEIVMVCVVSAIALGGVSVAEGQKVTNPPVAPIPSQILSGKKLFISNGDGDELFSVPNLAYNELYAAMRGWGRYELVAAPGDADLIFEVRYVGRGNPQLRCVILDPKTHVVLWHIVEYVQPWAREATGRKYFDKGMVSLVGELKMLAAHNSPASDAAAPNK